jgi:serpin B
MFKRRLAGVLVAAACAGQSISEPHPGAALTALPRDLSPAERSVGNAANELSFALWHQLNAAQRDSNVVVSPLSASFALGMTMNGARGATLDEIRGALRFGATTVPDIDAGYHALIGLLTSLDPSVTMRIANSIWYRNTFPFEKRFLDIGSTYFDATVSPLNFDDQSTALAAINGWVSDKTTGRIPSIVDEIHRDDVMFLINALYFKGSWRSRFDATLTESSVFHGIGGDQPVKLMHKHARMAYAETPTFQAVDLPYGDSAFTMTVILPKPGNDVADVAAALDATSWQQLSGAFGGSDVNLYLPKLTVAWQGDLIPSLQALGMRSAFIPHGADFTAMSSSLGDQLYLSLVRQKTFVSIDEEGTEAAAVTAVGVTVTAVEVPRLVRIDRPFLFAIRERLTGTVLFLAKINRLE